MLASRHPPATVQRVSVEGGRVRQCRLAEGRSLEGWGLVVAALRLEAGLLHGAQGPPPGRHGSARLTFDPAAVCLGTDPGVDLPVGLALVGGAHGVPQVPVPQTCQQTHF